MLQKHSVSIKGHQTSFSLEEIFYKQLKRIAKVKHIPLAQLITQIDATRNPQENLSSALRVYILEDLIEQLNTHKA